MLLTSVMENYFSNTSLNESSTSDNPVSIKKSNWIQTKDRLEKYFVFEERKFKEVFIVELLKYLRESNCLVEFTCKKEGVLILIKSLSPYITELELEAANDILKIKKDVMYYYAK